MAISSLHQQNYYWRFDKHLIADIDRHLFTPYYWQSRNAVVGKESGRGTTWFVEAQTAEDGTQQWVLRHYLRGGLMSKLSRDRYLFKGLKHCRSIAEFEILHRLHAENFPVPRPVAAQVIRHGLHYRADILTQRIAGARDLVQVLQEAQPTEFYEELASLIARFMQAGVAHADLNIQNILMDEQKHFWLIDFDRACIRKPAEAWQNRVLARLQRSFEKEQQRHNIAWTNADWNVFINRYQKLVN